MSRIYVGRLLEPIEIKKTLSQERYENALKKKFKIKYSHENNEDVPDNTNIETESVIVPQDEQVENIGDSEERSTEKYFGKGVVISPLAYYTVDDSLKHALNDYKEQIKTTTDIIMAQRSKYGQKAATINDRKDVLGEYPEKSSHQVYVDSGIKTGPGLKVKRHYFTRPINGIMYRISIDENPLGIGQSKRNTYMLVDIAVIFYYKNGIGLGKEIVARSKILRIRKRAPR
jgi:hypothetical protein